ncbi:MAG: sulfatase-like hydrolase/transferase [Phycisphaerales bacterium]|nr:MAG: sulfatase-like hydrolase/transferase [Phycisphaerales bacterium]
MYEPHKVAYMTIRKAWIGFLFLVVSVCSAGQKPNLLFVFSDQQSRDMLGCYGNRDIKTPNLDRLAAEGIRFNHCVSSYPVCTPYRGMLLSGQHPLYCGTVANDVPLLANNGRYLPHILRDAGYRMGYVGKWHLLGHDRKRPIPPGKMRYGFDGMFYSNNCHVDYRAGKCYYWDENDKQVFFDEWEVYGQTKQALDFLDGCSPDEPFALMVSWHPPHDWGMQSWEEFIYRYETLPELMDLYDREKIALRPHVEDTPLVRQAYHGYYAMCSGVDIAFGRLMAKLKEKGLQDNTLVVFTSDHGDNLNSYNYKTPKSHPEDTALRVPLLMRWPQGLPQARTSELLVGTLDLMPTLLGLLGHPIPPTVQGQDLSRAIRNGDDDVVDSVPLFYHGGPWFGVYTRDVTYARGQVRHWAHVEDAYRGRAMVPVRVLYDRSRDPHQLKNLYGLPETKDLQQRMEQLTQKWMARFGDPGLSVDQIRNLYQIPRPKSAHSEEGDSLLMWPEDTLQPGFKGRPIDVIQARSEL